MTDEELENKFRSINLTENDAAEVRKRCTEITGAVIEHDGRIEEARVSYSDLQERCSNLEEALKRHDVKSVLGGMKEGQHGILLEYSDYKAIISRVQRNEEIITKLTERVDNLDALEEALYHNDDELWKKLTAKRREGVDEGVFSAVSEPCKPKVLGDFVKAGKTYRNIKTGRLYRVLLIVTASWDSGQLLAVYEPVGGGSPWARSVTEFREKFEEAENDYSC